ncbi:putative quinol monooxygenase [Bradyrhizobium prioriisuperbiae]|uniref:putative quinol monooxygenase n=1 Tax=Bradyrhizobium prioriisuperbiae TaxID=2854389 RepID=UPI0028E5B077|nr:putative quinol monooxygenase [Bradyrhizobium prioritasuperba]
MSEPLVVFARLKAQSGKAEALGLALRAVVAPTRAEPGALDYVLHRSVDDPNTWLLYERWISRAALDAHFEQPHMKVLLARASELIDGDVEMRLAKIVDD